jgi:heme oxygenase (biliverdin-producing, ferredoxin)
MAESGRAGPSGPCLDHQEQIVTTAEETVATEFATRLREATWSDHENAEQDGYMQHLLKGELTLQQFGALTAQLYFVYLALETAADAQAGDPLSAAFVFPEINRLPAIEKDLEFFYGADWREQIAPLPATAAYAAHITEVTPTWGGGFIAHHYTRYLGDLSGGIMMRKAGERTYDLKLGEDGLHFYTFPDLEDSKAFKFAYRDQLNEIDVDDAEQQRIIDEVRTAYRLNSAVFGDLSRAELADQQG